MLCVVLLCVVCCLALCCVCCRVLSCLVLCCVVLSLGVALHHVRVRVCDAGLGLEFPKERFLQFIALLDPVPVDILNNLGLGLGWSCRVRLELV